MFRFVFGALVGGLAAWYWGDEIREYAASRARGARQSTADMVRSASQKAEGLLDQAGDQVGRTTQTAQGAVRSAQSNR